ncbi:sensor histidine kinase [Nonomuraea gerenzanensis]|uniref:histidine kinase n=1 Tax=Nonomuraea gerenzanensis TaxID=93944 RepID=A0A1M4EMB9_9ACTN|nr:HAMP domain-containing sensor histidine kinase [Nonomuraea gerenzanensis]UBU11502.1 HAMP domain-containing histidine kinase [Nonomuraea gerenzanensis]SBO99990.1 Chemotaxis protein methyltransferase CheR [Nonomuraea gerenzanensis]
MAAEVIADRPYRLARRVVTRAPRLPLVAGLAGLTAVAVAVMAGPAGWWPVLVAAGGLAGGAGLAVAGLRGMVAAQQAELDRLGELVERRAEQVTALSHELRTPLSMIKGAVDLLGEGSPGPLTPAQQRFVAVLDRQCGQVIDLCESLLTQAKIEAGLFTPRLEQVDISVIARDVVTAMRALCAERQQRITLDTPQVTPPIPADPMLIAQALTNLLSNAGRFTTVGGSIDVRVMAIDTGIAVYVTDDGAGMTKEQRRRLFHRFVTGRPLADGTGLGLVITKTIVELHGGSIMVDTTSMHGTTFLFTLPGREET